MRVDGHPGVRVYADDQLVGVTGRDGSVTVPNLRAFEPNRLRIDEADLPLEAQIDATEQVVRPFARTGSVVRFPVRMERGVLMRVRREDGTDLPAGAMVELEGGDTFVMVTGSEVYVPNLTGTHPFQSAGTAARAASPPPCPRMTTRSRGSTGWSARRRRPMPLPRIDRALLAGLALLAASPAFGACTASTAAVSFGAYDTLSPANDDSTGT